MKYSKIVMNHRLRNMQICCACLRRKHIFLCSTQEDSLIAAVVMSLFRVKEWCSIRIGGESGQSESSSGGGGRFAAEDSSLGQEESFDIGCLCVANLLNDPTKVSEQIIVASFTGVIRIYDFNSSFQEDVGLTSSVKFKPENLLLEKQMLDPIVQIATGYFVSVSGQVHLAVLYSRKLIVYTFKAIAAGKIEYGEQYDLMPVYEHKLARSAFNMVCGPFGGVQNKDFFCIQSLDCTLSFYEEENYTFARFLPGSLLPGPLAYVEKTDSFLTVSSSWHLEAYKYQFLAVAADSKTKEEAANVTTGKRVTVDWSFNVGECVMQIAVVSISPAPLSILLLGERSVFCLSECGVLRFMKKLDCSPACLLAYSATYEGYLQYMLAMHTQSLLIYVDTTLKWAARLTTQVPVALAVVQNGPLRGILVMLNDTGSLILCYLGTDPAFYGMPVQQNDTTSSLSAMDFDRRRKEFKRVQALIKKFSMSDRDTSQDTMKANLLQITCEMAQNFDAISLAYNTEVDESVPSLTVRIIVVAKTLLRSVQIFVSHPDYIGSQSNAFLLDTLDGREEIPLTVFMKYTAVPSTTISEIRVIYFLPDGNMGFATSSFTLPLRLISKTCPSQKSASHKITLEVNKPVINLTDLFPDFNAHDSDTAATTLAFRLYGKQSSSVTIMASSQTQKYRIQSDLFELQWIYIYELIQRLRKRYSAPSGNSESTEFRIRFRDELPLGDYFVVIDRHFELRKQKEKLKEVLTQKSAQFRTIEKQLLIKSKDSTCSPFSHLEELIEMTHQQIISVANAILELDQALKNVCYSLTAATRLQIELLSLSLDTVVMKDRDKKWLEYCFFPEISEDMMFWEEHTDAAINHTLLIMSRGHLSDNSITGQPDPDVQRLSDTVRFKKRISLLFEKLIKSGGRILPDEMSTVAEKPKTKKAVKTAINKDRDSIDTNRSDITDAKLGDANVPIGSTFNEMGSRILSNITEEEKDESLIDHSSNANLLSPDRMESYPSVAHEPEHTL